MTQKWLWGVDAQLTQKKGKSDSKKGFQCFWGFRCCYWSQALHWWSQVSSWRTHVLKKSIMQGHMTLLDMAQSLPSQWISAALRALSWHTYSSDFASGLSGVIRANRKFEWFRRIGELPVPLRLRARFTWYSRFCRWSRFTNVTPKSRMLCSFLPRAPWYGAQCEILGELGARGPYRGN